MINLSNILFLEKFNLSLTSLNGFLLLNLLTIYFFGTIHILNRLKLKNMVYTVLFISEGFIFLIILIGPAILPSLFVIRYGFRAYVLVTISFIPIFIQFFNNMDYLKKLNCYGLTFFLIVLLVISIIAVDSLPFRRDTEISIHEYNAAIWLVENGYSNSSIITII